jgi:hypothetical protein
MRIGQKRPNRADIADSNVVSKRVAYPGEANLNTCPWFNIRSAWLNISSERLGIGLNISSG